MNITIYYLSKKVILQKIKGLLNDEPHVNIDSLKKSELMDRFKDFALSDTETILHFVTSDIENALEKFRKPFKYIYAAGGLIEKDDRFLFIFRLKKWDLPKGKLDAGEGPEHAAIRECEEECGITRLSITKTLEPTYHIYDHKGSYALKKTYWYVMETEHTGKLVPQTEEHIEKVEWFTREEIQSIVKPNTYPAILQVIKDVT
ncbi:MAG: ADP-ribose pyrophosphatase [Bacteroidota bacterium]|jgi:8-oxo-dGTP pyrophosphatase MutT (NUDIX family)|nr:ADP-ribose pyrophosphatase [Bacteroidota bacterium]